MARSRVKQKAYQKKYMDAHIMLTAILDRKDDKDIISWLGKQENRSEAVRRALRASIEYEEATKYGK